MKRLVGFTLALAALLVTPLGARAQSPTPFVVPAWAFPTSPAPNPPPPVDSVTPMHVPGSVRTFTIAFAKGGYDVADWFPGSHPTMPAPVRYGRRPAARACGFCHLADGAGRPENAVLAGLPVEYIRKQVTAFRDGTRLTANPASSVNSMHVIAKAVSDTEVTIAAEYFAKLRLKRRNRVVETTRVPTTRIEIMLYALHGRGNEPIAGRLIEVPERFDRHELHDPSVVYTTYVPPGSIARGQRLAAAGPSGAATACATCHGPTLLGVGEVPPIAGRAPSYILRQLMNIRTGARHDSASVAMLPVVERLSVDDMVALAAYVGSRPPLDGHRKR